MGKFIFGRMIPCNHKREDETRERLRSDFKKMKQYFVALFEGSFFADQTSEVSELMPDGASLSLKRFIDKPK